VSGRLALRGADDRGAPTPGGSGRATAVQVVQFAAEAVQVDPTGFVLGNGDLAVGLAFGVAAMDEVGVFGHDDRRAAVTD
jgi:hypothetical protein